jgi:hypothetical protein
MKKQLTNNLKPQETIKNPESLKALKLKIKFSIVSYLFRIFNH